MGGKKNNNQDVKDFFQAAAKTNRGRIGSAIAIISIIAYLNGKLTFIGFFFFLLVGGVFISSVIASKHRKEEEKIVSLKEEIKNSATKCIGDYIYVNERDQTWCVPSSSLRQYSFDELLGYSVIENGDEVAEGSIAGTVVGAMAGGFTGALLGASASKISSVCNNLGIKISVNDMDTPIIYITVLNKETKKKWDEYKKAVNTAEQITGVLSVIMARRGS